MVEEATTLTSESGEGSTPAGDAPANAKQARRGSARRADVQEPATPKRRVPLLLQHYQTEALPVLMQEFGYSNAMQAPRPKKLVLNIGLGEALSNARALEAATRDLTQISGQKPVITRARKSIAAFKLRAGQPIGAMVTLRGDRMYNFLEKLLHVALPRSRDFRGVSRKAFDGFGNYSLGIEEQVIFPEIDYNAIDKLRGLQVNIVTSARTDGEALRLLELLGVPFTRVQDPAGTN